MTDDEARRAIREDFDHTLWVEAAAGTGKTTELVRRIVGLVSAGRCRLASTVAVTFTEKAAGELRLRLRAELEAAASHAADRLVLDRLHGAVRELESARVGTIHALCAELLRERPVEGGVDPLFDVLGEPEEDRLYDASFRRWLEGILEAPPEGVRRVLRRPPDAHGRGPVRDLFDAGRTVVERRDFDGAWTRPPFDRGPAIDAFVEALRAFAAFAGRSTRDDDPLALGAGVAARWLVELDRREQGEPRDHDALEAELPTLRKRWEWKKTGRTRLFGPDIPRNDVRAARDLVRDTLDALVVACEEDLAACLFEDLRSLVARYEDDKQRANRLDYVDLLVLAKRMLVRDGSVRSQLQQAFTHVFVDEFQDTDPLQADVLLLLVADDPDCADPAAVRPVPGKLFVVGDPKQAIYRFRRADVACYTELRERLVGQGARVVQLSTSFRADPRIQAAVNAAFAPRMDGRGQAAWVPLREHRCADETRPAVVALPVPRPYGRGEVTKDAIDRSLPDAIANFVQWLVTDSGWTVTAGEGGPVPLAARHVCLLFRSTRRRRVDLLGPYAQALEARGIAHAVVGGRAFHDRDEVQALRNALAAIEWPDDTLSVYATLKGPLFALPDDALFLWKSRVGTLDPFHRPEGDGLQDVRDALAVLAGLRAGRNRLPIASTVHELLAATRAHAGFAAAAGGEQVLANVLRVGQHARRFEAAGTSSFRAFLDALDDEAARQEAPEAPVVEEGTDGVRLMTVHKSKGLEFPVVILADLTTAHTHSRPSRFIDAGRRLWATPLCGAVPHDLRLHRDEVLAEDRFEADRIAYVAATRARDLLVVPALGDGALDTWVAPLHAALVPPDDTRHAGRPAGGCPAFTGPTVLDAAPGRAPVAAGLHDAAGGEVVWWEALPDEHAPVGGLRHVPLLAEEGDRGAGAARWEAWTHAHAERLRSGGQPTIDAVLATDVRGVAGAVQIARTEVDHETRPYGPRFGSLVHAVLAAVAFEAAEDEVRATVALHARILGATPEERTAAVAAVGAALRHPLLRRALASTDCRREVAVAWRDGDRLVEGVADLAFREGDAWVVVDYKTDDVARGRYDAQLGAYVAAIAAATRSTVAGVVFAV